LTLLRADHSLRTVDCKTRVHFFPGQYLLIFRDVTPHKKLEEEQRHSQKMATIGQRACGVAHDFNNLLTVINGSAELLLTQLGTNDPAASLVHQIKASGERAAGLTRQLLVFSRKAKRASDLLCCNEVLDGIKHILRNLIGEEVNLIVLPAPDLWRIKADPRQIEQIILNLVVNARDAMPLGGMLTVETKNVVLDEAHVRQRPNLVPGPFVSLTVTDTGCGMDPAIQARFFEPFFTTKGPDKGTGLGLVTVLEIVKERGGHVEVRSKVGQGSALEVFFPCESQAAASLETLHTSEKSPHGGETVLVVEDDSAVRTLIRLILQKKGYAVLDACNGAEALQLLEHSRGPIQLLITDVVMPQMNGRPLAEHLVSFRPGLKVLYPGFPRWLDRFGMAFAPFPWNTQRF
jgi:two-component system, cell cycle sensor histidine kinase and response regulator CckA